MTEKIYVVSWSYVGENTDDYTHEMEYYKGDDEFRVAVIAFWLKEYDETLYLFITDDKKKYGWSFKSQIAMNFLGREDIKEEDLNPHVINVTTLSYPLTYNSIYVPTVGCKIINDLVYFIKNQPIMDLISLMLNMGEPILKWEMYLDAWRRVLIFEEGKYPPKIYDENI